MLQTRTISWLKYTRTLVLAIEELAVLRIRDVFLYPGSDFFYTGYRIPDPNFFHPGSASNNLTILTPKNGFYALGNMIRVVHPGSRILDPDPQHWELEDQCKSRLCWVTTGISWDPLGGEGKEVTATPPPHTHKHNSPPLQVVFVTISFKDDIALVSESFHGSGIAAPRPYCQKPSILWFEVAAFWLLSASTSMVYHQHLFLFFTFFGILKTVFRLKSFWERLPFLSHKSPTIFLTFWKLFWVFSDWKAFERGYLSWAINHQQFFLHFGNPCRTYVSQL